MSLIFRTLRPFISTDHKLASLFSSANSTANSTTYSTTYSNSSNYSNTSSDLIYNTYYINKPVLSEDEYESVLSYIHAGNLPYTEETIKLLLENFDTHSN